jgi:hypothetical protein
MQTSIDLKEIRGVKGKGRTTLTEVGETSWNVRYLWMYGPRLIRSRGCGKNFQFRYYQRAKFHESESVALIVWRGGRRGVKRRHCTAWYIEVQRACMSCLEGRHQDSARGQQG